jgi:hypothetical protein
MGGCGTREEVNILSYFEWTSQYAALQSDVLQFYKVH